jgi:hypothetical protein
VYGGGGRFLEGGGSLIGIEDCGFGGCGLGGCGFGVGFGVASKSAKGLGSLVLLTSELSPDSQPNGRGVGVGGFVSGIPV